MRNSHYSVFLLNLIKYTLKNKTYKLINNKNMSQHKIHNKIRNFKERDYYFFLSNKLCELHQDLRAKKLINHNNSMSLLKNKIDSYTEDKHKMMETYGISNEDNSDG